MRGLNSSMCGCSVCQMSSLAPKTTAITADVNEAKEHGATLMIDDILFGTFVYRFGVLPEALG